MRHAFLDFLGANRPLSLLVIKSNGAKEGVGKKSCPKQARAGIDHPVSQCTDGGALPWWSVEERAKVPFQPILS